jgi:glycosyltransferase involved in cell wall biosynthesis
VGRGEKIESAAVEEDSGAVVEGVTEATGIGLEGLDFGVEALGHGVGDGEKREVEQPLRMLGQHLGDLYHFRQAGFHHPAFPFFEVGSRFLEGVAFPKLPNGIEDKLIKPIPRTQLGIGEEAFVLCCVSRAIPDKGWEEAIEVVSAARKITNRDIVLILVGNGAVYEQLLSKGVPDFVKLIGFSERSVDFYAAADMGIMLTTFKSESFPLTIVDCLFAGRPFISCDVGEIKSMLTEENLVAGAVVSLSDWQVPIDKVAEILATFAINPEALQSATATARRISKKFHIDQVVKNYVEIFERDVRKSI